MGVWVKKAYIEQKLNQVDASLTDVEDLFERLSHVLADDDFAAVAVLDQVAFGQRNREVRFYFLLQVQNVLCLVDNVLSLSGSLRG